MIKFVFAGSAALLVVAGIGWQSQASVPPRSDLVGAPVLRDAPRDPRSSQHENAEPRASSEIDFDKLLGGSFSQNSDGNAEKPRTTQTLSLVDRLGAPGRISIPSLNVNAPVVPVGVNDDQSMDIPGAEEAGWFMLGPRPGDAMGSAVLAGHVDHNRKPGVFIELRRLEVGAEVSLQDEAGKLLRYVVSERFQIDKDKLETAELFRHDGPPVLTLITCGGAFDRKHRTYTDNIVIRAVPTTLAPTVLSTPLRTAR